ncbi:hypothetical protein Tco_0239920, partial [Tanacetum coccineum]
MPTDSNEPPDPLAVDLSYQSIMTSADDSYEASLNDSKMKVLKGSDVSLVDNRGGKRTSTPINGEINEVLSDLSS